MPHEPGVDRPVRRGSIADKLLQFFGVSGIGASRPEVAARGMADTEAELAAALNPQPETSVSEDISKFLRTPAPIPESINQFLPRSPIFGNPLADIFDLVAGVPGGEFNPIQEPAPPRTPLPPPTPLPDFASALGGAGGGGAGGPTSIRSPFISAPSGPGVPLPDIPDPNALLARLEALGPTVTPERDSLPFILQGIAAGAARPESNFGELILNAGLGALGGVGQAGQARAADAREFTEADRDFQIALANAQAVARGQFFERETGQAQELQRRQERGETLGLQEAAQLQPRFDSGFLLSPERQGEEIETTITNLRPAAGAASAAATQLRIALSQVQAVNNPSSLFSFIESVEGGGEAIEDIAAGFGITMGQGVELSLAQKKQIATQLAVEFPDIMEQAMQFGKIAGALSGLGGREPGGF